MSAADRLVSLVEAARAVVIREIEDRDATHEVASCPVAEWLGREHAHTAQRARSMVQDAVRVGQFPALAAAHAAGTVSTAQAAVIARMLTELPDDLASAELAAATATMIGFAAEHDPAELSRLGWRLLETIAPERAEDIIADQLERDEKRAAKKRGLALFPDHHGAWVLRGSLLDAEGEELHAILSAYADSAWKHAADDPAGPKPKDAVLANALLNMSAPTKPKQPRPPMVGTGPG